MRDGPKHYYEVALALPATWKENVYTYSSAMELKIGSVVFAPFGSAEKTGYIVRKSSKPTYNTKDISIDTGIVLPKKTLIFADWLNNYYPGTPGVNAQHFLPAFLKSIDIAKPLKANGDDKKGDIPPLTTVQKEAYKSLINNSGRVSVLHGITGSGKTRVYSELANTTIESGKHTLILYPEISLTSQMLENLSSYFGSENIAVYHSKQTKTQQRETWLRVYKSEKPMIIIGPRSAMFLPYKNLGLVIVDEAHENSYKQDSGTRYNGLIASSALAKAHNAQIVFGSATPPVSETNQILTKGGKLVCMHDLAKDKIESGKQFEVIDMTKKENQSKSYLLSKQLVDEMKQSLQANKQSLIFLNKRGTAKMIICENCSWHASCLKCEMPLTHHHDTFTLQCHVCGFKKKSVISCPDCGSELTLKNPGIKAIEEEIKLLLPGAKIARFDSDNNKKDSFHENYEQIRKGSADLIIGTQLITKGLDLPLLNLVGVLQADSALLLPDYTSEERGFQQLTQVSGRVGRGHTAGKVIIQTYQPESYVFNYVKDQDWHGFYDLELSKRKESQYPPYAFAAKVWVTKTTRDNAKKACDKFVSVVAGDNTLRVLGPAPSFYEKTNNKFSWQVILLSSNRATIVDIVKKLPTDFYYDLDPVSFL